MELKAGDDSTSNAYQRYETLRLMLYNHVKKGTPLPAHETVSSLIQKINASREHYLQKLNDLTHDRVRPEKRPMVEHEWEEEEPPDPTLSDAIERQKKQSSPKTWESKVLRTIAPKAYEYGMQLLPVEQQTLIEQTRQGWNKLPADLKTHLWQNYFWPPDTLKHITGLPEGIEEGDLDIEPEEQTALAFFRPEDDDLGIFATNKRKRLGWHPPMAVDYFTERAARRWARDREREAREAADDTWKERKEISKHAFLGRSSGPEEDRAKLTYIKDQRDASDSQKGSGVRGVSKRRKKLPRLRKAREWVTVRG